MDVFHPVALLLGVMGEGGAEIRPFSVATRERKRRRERARERERKRERLRQSERERELMDSSTTPFSDGLFSTKQ